MKIIKATLSVLACGAAFAAPRVARADDPPDIYSYAWHDSSMQSDIGISTLVGGGIGGFTDQSMRNTLTSSVDGLWNLRVTIGSHTPLALDLNYLGSAANINSLVGSRQGTLVGTTAEGALRYNILPHYAWNPYAFVGIGWQRYDVSGGSFNLSDTGMRSSDNSVVFPMGAGLAYRDPTGLVVDLHGTFRPVADAGLVLQTVGTNNFVPMHTWEASAAIGYEF